MSGPSCTTPGQTCILGRCQSDYVGPTSLEAWETNWVADTPDICKPANHGPPVVVVGEGQTDYNPVTDGETIQAELGPQGGHHVWIAVRMHNLKQAGSTTKITGVQPGTSLTVPTTSYVFTYDQDEGGYCKLYGLRFQLDAGGTDYQLFLGKPLDVTVVVTDTTGLSATGTAHLQIAPTILVP